MPNYPNWPGSESMPDAPKETQQPDCPIVPVVITNVPQPTTIQSAKAQGLGVGDIIGAPLAPASGPIQGAPESLVAVTVKNFFDTKTWKAIRTVLQAAAAAIILTLGVTFTNTWAKGQSIFSAGAVDWRATEIACEVSGGGVIVLAVMTWAKKVDNNPSK